MHQSQILSFWKEICLGISTRGLKACCGIEGVIGFAGLWCSLWHSGNSCIISTPWFKTALPPLPMRDGEVYLHALVAAAGWVQGSTVPWWETHTEGFEILATHSQVNPKKQNGGKSVNSIAVGDLGLGCLFVWVCCYFCVLFCNYCYFVLTWRVFPVPALATCTAWD